MHAHLRHGDHVNHRVEAPVATPVQAVALRLARGDGERGDARVHGEGGLAAEVPAPATWPTSCRAETAAVPDDGCGLCRDRYGAVRVPAGHAMRLRPRTRKLTQAELETAPPRHLGRLCLPTSRVSSRARGVSYEALGICRGGRADAHRGGGVATLMCQSAPSALTKTGVTETSSRSRPSRTSEG